MFCGQTPVGQPGKTMPASAVNVVGRVLGDALTTVMRERAGGLETARDRETGYALATRTQLRPACLAA